MNNAKQMSESIELGIVLAISGGFMDAYSYMCRGEVFANAQTGNMLLLGINLSKGNLKMAAEYFFPVISFAIGIALAYIVRTHVKEENTLHWRQISVLCEAIVLLIVSFMPQNLNLLANSITSFACGIQVQSFRKIHGNGIATTMCIGNLRSGTEHICNYLFNSKDKKAMEKGLLYCGIIFSFIIGAVIGDFFVDVLKERAIMLCSIMLIISFIMMFVDKEKNKLEAAN
ncbi:MAG: YoaK family protein [Clostridiales bacterium]|nr:YoaK family protein [Clostridiales bacterium]NLK22858.1 DUF1275 domain-containing protein [Clostridiales bacterium]